MPKQKLIALLVLVQIIELLNLQQENAFVMKNIMMMEVTIFVNHIIVIIHGKNNFKIKIL